MGWQFYDRNGALKQAAAGAVNPMAKVWRSTAQSIVSAATPAAIVFDTVVYDTDGLWSVVTPTYLSIKTAGKYLVSGNILLAPATGGSQRFASLQVNGVDVANQSAPLTNDYGRMSLDVVVNLAVGDKVYLTLYQDSGGAVNTYTGNGSNTLTVTKIDGVVYVPSKPPRITTSPLSGGPPASPDDGDIWIATGVDANDTRWQFSYNAASASAYKWDFIGGPSTLLAAYYNPINITTTGWTDLSSGITLTRAGDYRIVWGVQTTVGAFTSTYFPNARASVGGVVGQVGLSAGTMLYAVGQIVFDEQFAAVAAASIVKLQGQNDRAGGGTTGFNFPWFSITPVRIS
jgi:hypothetical protein